MTFSRIVCLSSLLNSCEVDLICFIVKISLNGNVARILSLAEVQVIGNTYEFDIPLGSLFNTPKREINHVAFIHDGGDESQTSFSNFAFVEMDTVKIAVSRFF